MKEGCGRGEGGEGVAQRLRLLGAAGRRCLCRRVSVSDSVHIETVLAYPKQTGGVSLTLRSQDDIDIVSLNSKSGIQNTHTRAADSRTARIRRRRSDAEGRMASPKKQPAQKIKLD